MADTMRFNSTTDTGCLVISVTTQNVGEYEAGVILPGVREQAPNTAWKIALNLEEVKLLASAGIGMIISLHNEAKAAGGRLVVYGINDQIMTMLKMCKMHKFFTIVPDHSKAISKLS